MIDLLCLVYVLNKAGKTGMPAKCSYSYTHNKCRCDNCRLYKKQYRHKQRLIDRTCCVHGCSNPHHGKDMCKKHYLSWYYFQNKEKIINNVKTYRIKNLDKIKETKSKYYEKNKDYLNNKSKKHRKENIHLERSAKRRKRAKIRNNGYEFYTEDQVLKLYGTNCYLCNNPINLNAPRLVGKPGWQYGLHIEHVINIALGGPDTLENVRPAHGICNLKKKPVGMV